MGRGQGRCSTSDNAHVSLYHQEAFGPNGSNAKAERPWISRILLNLAWLLPHSITEIFPCQHIYPIIQYTLPEHLQCVRPCSRTGPHLLRKHTEPRHSEGAPSSGKTRHINLQDPRGSPSLLLIALEHPQHRRPTMHLASAFLMDM